MTASTGGCAVDRALLQEEYSNLLDYLGSAGATPPAHPLTPSLDGYLLLARHLASYELVEEYAGEDVLEVGCFLGYGSALLSGLGHDVTAIDLDRSALEAASKRGAARFVCADATDMPFEDCSFDSVIGLQVLEHLSAEDARRFIAECSRVLRRDGSLLLATPNRHFRLMPGQKPWNPDHQRELDAAQVRDLLSPWVDEVTIKGSRASGWIEDVERKRVGRSAFRAYVAIPAVKLAKAAAPAVAGRGRRPPASPTSLDEFLAAAPDVGTGDFRLVDEVDKKAMEIIAIARTGP